jgi:predicted nucleic acid-binding protein
MSNAGDKAPIFLDANIFVDILQKRSGWQSSLAVVAAVNTKKLNECLSSLTVAIIHYIWRQQVSESQARDDIRNIMDGFDILAVTSEHIYSSLSDSKFKDFEDALQFHSARGIAGSIITRNKRHYSKVADEVQILTPEECLRR